MVAKNHAFPPDRWEERLRARSALVRAIHHEILANGALRDPFPLECGGYLEVVAELRNPNGWGYRTRPKTLKETLANCREPTRQLLIEFPPPRGGS